jgi:hypothetical protein
LYILQGIYAVKEIALAAIAPSPEKRAVDRAFPAGIFEIIFVCRSFSEKMLRQYFFCRKITVFIVS